MGFGNGWLAAGGPPSGGLPLLSAKNRQRSESATIQPGHNPRRCDSFESVTCRPRDSQLQPIINRMKVELRRAMCQAVLMLISFLAMPAGAQFSARDQGSVQDTQVHGYWIDPSTSLMWARRDNDSHCHLQGIIRLQIR